MPGGGIADRASMWGGAGILIVAIGRAIDIILDRGHDASPRPPRRWPTSRRMRTLVPRRPAPGRNCSDRLGGELLLRPRTDRWRVPLDPRGGDASRLRAARQLDACEPQTELGRIPRDSITDAVIVDETGNEVADQLLDPIRELETPEEERYTVLLKRRDASGALPPVSFLFSSGEPALACRDQYRGCIRPRSSIV